MEQVYQYLWKHRLLTDGLTTVDGRPVTVLYQGRHNCDAGPDFTGARLRIGDQEWAGNVEIHVRASDWMRHHHDSDPSYANTILHIVAVSNRRIPDGRGGVIPQAVIGLPEPLLYLYTRLAEKISAVPCEELLGELTPLTVVSWTESLSVERMQQKAGRILDTVKQTGGDWERACFITLARGLGFSLNSEPLEMLARSLPLNVLAKHSDDLMQLEALLFGQAGMLDSTFNIFDEYYQRLCREYRFLAIKYGLRPMRRDIWKYARTRPQNFPARRIALLARSLSGGFSLMSRITDPATNADTARSLFDWRLDGYWENMSDFGHPAPHSATCLSEQNIRLLTINVAAPMLYAYGAWRGEPETSERGLDIWEGTPPENNSITRQWKSAGITCANAADSQALIQLRREYCDRNRCLECRFGYTLLRNRALK